MTKIPELLAPAGNMDKLMTAVRFGADAVYAAADRYGLRAFADNFTTEALGEAARLLHALGKKLYVTVNIYADERDIAGLPAFAEELAATGADGVLVSDLGVFSIMRRYAPGLPLHVSTQANVTNSEAAKMWADLGASRIVLARETRLADIPAIKAASGAEIEAFVHGAMCIAYSGRCLLSGYFTGRSGNRGECVQSCRWEYGLTELSRGETLPAEEDGRGTYILSSRDLCMIAHLRELADAGVDSVKIEGRMKSEYYVAGIVNAYRRALDDMAAGRPFDERLIEETEKVSHRGYTTGFYFDEKGGATGEPRPRATYDFVAVAAEDCENGTLVVEMRNRFEKGDTLEILSPTGISGMTFEVTDMTGEDGRDITVADRVCEKVRLRCGLPVGKYDILRRKRRDRAVW